MFETTNDNNICKIAMFSVLFFDKKKPAKHSYDTTNTPASYGKFPLVYTFNEQVKQWQNNKYIYVPTHTHLHYLNGTNGKLLFLTLSQF